LSIDLRYDKGFNQEQEEIRAFKPPSPHRIKTLRQCLTIAEYGLKMPQPVNAQKLIQWATWRFHISEAAAKGRVRVVVGWYKKKGMSILK
jgi:hypothetical protein